MTDMTDKDFSDASAALIDWFEDQDIALADAARVLTITLIALIQAIAERNGSNARDGGKIINAIIAKSLK